MVPELSAQVPSAPDTVFGLGLSLRLSAEAGT